MLEWKRLSVDRSSARSVNLAEGGGELEIQENASDKDILALVRGRKAGGKGWDNWGKGKGGGKGWSEEKGKGKGNGNGSCINCGFKGHNTVNCTQSRVEPSKRPRFKGGKPGHLSHQCRSKPANSITPLPDEEPSVDSHAMRLEYQQPKHPAKHKPVPLANYAVLVRNKFCNLIAEAPSPQGNDAFEKVAEHHANLFGSPYTLHMKPKYNMKTQKAVNTGSKVPVIIAQAPVSSLVLLLLLLLLHLLPQHQRTKLQMDALFSVTAAAGSASLRHTHRTHTHRANTHVTTRMLMLVHVMSTHVMVYVMPVSWKM